MLQTGANWQDVEALEAFKAQSQTTGAHWPGGATIPWETWHHPAAEPLSNAGLSAGKTV